jgi:hypothetical protein
VSGLDRSDSKITSTSIMAEVKPERLADFPQSASGVCELFDFDGRAKLADFGLAKIYQHDPEVLKARVQPY